MPVDAEKWHQDMIDKGIIPDKDGYFHYKVDVPKHTVRIRVDITGMLEFVMEIEVPNNRDSEEYIDQFLDGILNENMRYNCEWEVD